MSNSHHKFDMTLSYKRLVSGDLKSLSAMRRDQDKCYHRTTGYYNRCNLCTEKLPCFDPKTKKCTKSKNNPRECAANEVRLFRENTCATSISSSCECHKAICWYFSSDVGAALH